MIPALLLAAGVSSRMGRPKALLPWEAEPLVRRVARALRDGGAAPVVVVVAPGAVGEAISAAVADAPEVAVTVNPRPERGMLSSVQAGLARALEGNARPGAFLVCPCDLPRLSARDVACVLGAWDGDAAGIVAPAFKNKRGHPTLFGVQYAGEVMALDSGNTGLNLVLRRHADRVREVALESDAILRDADTPDEWRALGGALPETEPTDHGKRV